MLNIFSRDTLATLCLETVPASLKVQLLLVVDNFPSGENPKSTCIDRGSKANFKWVVDEK